MSSAPPIAKTVRTTCPYCGVGCGVLATPEADGSVTIAGDTSPAFVHSDTPTKLKVTGIDLYSLGDFADGDDREEIVLRDDAAGIYKRLILRDDRVIGAVLYGETGDGPWFFEMLQAETGTQPIRDTLIFGRAYETAAKLEAYGGRCSVAG